MAILKEEKFMQKILVIKDLEVSIKETKILKGVNLSMNRGETHAIMGPNGSGKSTLTMSIMGHPRYTISNGSITFDGKDISSATTDERSHAGIFLAFQSPLEIEGLKIKDFLFQAYSAQKKNKGERTSVPEFEKLLVEKIKALNLPPAFVERSLNCGFSGGEKKQIEVLQLAMLSPKFVILDEIDSGLDVDALKTICGSISQLKQAAPDTAILIITHYPRILHYLIPDKVHVLQNGVIVQSGNKELAYEIEKEGYSKIDL